MQSMREDTDIGALGIGDAAELLGVTVRTLRHWETIGLLAPEWRTAGGHRLYVEEDLERAQRILVYREVGLPLAEIRALVDGDADARTHLARQRRLLVERASHLRRMIGAVDDMMEAIDMDRKMSAREAAEKFGGGWNEEYAEEAEQRWGDTDAWAQSRERNASRTAGDWDSMFSGHKAIVAAIGDAVRSGADPDSEVGRRISARHRASIAQHYDCTHGRQVLLARMYVGDDRFRATYENEGGGGAPGAVEWLVAAVEADARANGVDPDTAGWD